MGASSILERGIRLDHSTIYRWVVRFTPQLLEAFNRRKRSVFGKWHMDETYIKVRGEWLYLYRAIDKAGSTVEFYFSKNRDLAAAKRFLRKALGRHERPVQVTIDGSQTNRTAILEADVEARMKVSESGIASAPTKIRKSKYMNNRIEQIQATSRANARLQIGKLRRHHPKRHRARAYDPKAAIGANRQRDSHLGRSVR